MKVSIIIPFFNSGPFLPEAIHSAMQASMDLDAELIVVNDGSTEADSLDMLHRLNQEGRIIVIHRENGGPAAARNTGVKASTGEFLLFLDSDNKLRPQFLKETLQAMESDPRTGVVYGNADFFGETLNRKAFVSRAFDKYELLLDNYIDVCSLVRRKAFDEVKGFEEDATIIGYEDWEFWIRLSATPWQFLYLPKVLFDYRLRKQSVITAAATEENYKKVLACIYGKNASIFQERFNELYHQSVFYKQDKQKPFRSYLKFLKGKYLSPKNPSF
jgi:glycosyltransferase involved in cell wall biosynthesis